MRHRERTAFAQAAGRRLLPLLALLVPLLVAACSKGGSGGGY